MACIYKITNQVNGKIYIGQTRRNLARRWSDHKKDAKRHFENCLLHSAMMKYGFDNFTIECIEECSVEQLDKLEKYWINKLDAQNRKIGYNICSGGASYNPEEKHEKQVNNGKVLALKYGKPVDQYTLDGKFVCSYSSRKEASNKTGIPLTIINYCCSGIIQYGKGFIWKDKNDVELIDKIRNGEVKIRERKSRPIKQYTFDGTFIKEYQSIAEAREELKIGDGGLRDCVEGKLRKASGYLWCYTGEEENIKPLDIKITLEKDGEKHDFYFIEDAATFLGVPAYSVLYAIKRGNKINEYNLIKHK